MQEARDKGCVIIVGGSGDIGRAVTKRLIEKGQSVHLMSRNAESLGECEQEFGVETSVVDATDCDGLLERCEAVREKVSSVSGLVNCVGSILLKPAHLTTTEEWHETLHVNLTSAFASVRAAARTFAKDGSLVLLSTAAASTGLANHEAIAAAKAGVEGLMRSAAASYAKRGIRVNAIAPGLVRTKLSKRITESESALKLSTQMHPLGRIGEAKEIASAITFLLDPEQSWITGQVLGVDGGLARVRAS